jgi:hypothetical protein
MDFPAGTEVRNKGALKVPVANILV